MGARIKIALYKPRTCFGLVLVYEEVKKWRISCTPLIQRKDIDTMRFLWKREEVIQGGQHAILKEGKEQNEKEGEKGQVIKLWWRAS